MIRILIAEDMQMLRESLKFMIESDSEMQVTALAQNGREALSICEKECPDVVVMDLKMPGLDGFDTTRFLKSKYPSIKVIALTTFNDEMSVSKAIECGVDGFITKDLGLAELHQSIKSVYLGLKIFQNIPKSNTSGKFNYTADNGSLRWDISNREKEIIKYISNGKSYKEIGDALHLSEGTIRNNVYELLGRLNLDDRIQLAVFAVKNNII
ncbi:MAG TPA: response regulator transcription factor [Clostridia bacterium]|nr:response regulator transcription factor [Clostridia bacterium]